MSTNVGMGECCLSGHINEGKPVGREDQIGGLPVYISEPKDGSKTKSLIFITDSEFPCGSRTISWTAY